MAGARAAKRDGDAATEEAQVTRRVVLHGAPAITLGHDLTGEQRAAVLKAAREAADKASTDRKAAKAKGIELVETAWVEVAEQEGATMARAIEAQAGKPGTPTAKPGLWKAIAVRSWTGGRKYTRPPEPLIQVESL